MSATPLAYDLYRHTRTGGLYRIVCIAAVEATLETVVVYRSDQDGQTWTRPLGEFMDGRFELLSAT